MQAISTILDNPRYSGYEFWHPYSVRRHPGRPPEAYQILVRSDRPAHPARVAIQDFLAVATMRSRPTRPRPSRTNLAEPILLHGISCAICGRTVSVSSKGGRVRYRCRPTPDGQAGWSLSVGVPRRIPSPGRARTVAAPKVRDVPSRAPGWSALHTMVDALNLRLAYDPETDSSCTTTAVGPTVAMTLIGN